MDTSVSAVSSVGKIVSSNILPTTQVPLPIVGNPDPPPKPVHAPAAESTSPSARPPAPPSWVSAAQKAPLAVEAAGVSTGHASAAQDAAQAPQATAVAQATPFYAEAAHDRAEPHPITTV